MYPILFHIGTFPVRSYGVMIMVAFLAGLWLVRRRANLFGFDPQKLTDLCFYILVAGILGARILFILQELPYYLSHKDELFSLRFEGLTSFGALIAGLGLVIVWAKRTRAPLGSLTDLLGPAFLLGHVFGRIGCYLNGCCYGRTCAADAPLATQFYGVPGFHVPAQLFDSAMNLVGLGLILLYERRGFRPGQGFGAVLIVHGLARFIYEFWREGTDAEVRSGIASSTYWGHLPITQAQGVAIALMVAGAAVWLIAARRKVTSDDPPIYAKRIGSPVPTEAQAA